MLLGIDFRFWLKPTLSSQLWIAIANGKEAIPQTTQLLAQFEIVVDGTVECQRQSQLWICHELIGML